MPAPPAPPDRVEEAAKRVADHDPDFGNAVQFHVGGLVNGLSAQELEAVERNVRHSGGTVTGRLSAFTPPMTIARNPLDALEPSNQVFTRREIPNGISTELIDDIARRTHRIYTRFHNYEVRAEFTYEMLDDLRLRLTAEQERAGYEQAARRITQSILRMAESDVYEQVLNTLLSNRI